MVTEVLAQVVDLLNRGGVAATVNPPEINPPGAWVAARRLDRSTLGGCGYAVVVDVVLIARDNGIPQALATLDGLLADTLDALDDYALDTSALDEAVTLPQGGGPLPAYRLTFIVE